MGTKRKGEGRREEEERRSSDGHRSREPRETLNEPRSLSRRRRQWAPTESPSSERWPRERVRKRLMRPLHNRPRSIDLQSTENRNSSPTKSLAPRFSNVLRRSPGAKFDRKHGPRAIFGKNMSISSLIVYQSIFVRKESTRRMCARMEWYLKSEGRIKWSLKAMLNEEEKRKKAMKISFDKDESVKIHRDKFGRFLKRITNRSFSRFSE